MKQPGAPNIPIQAIGLSLYEQLGTDEVEEPGTKVTRTQWLDLSSLEMKNLIGKHVLIVDEVDDTRTTLEYAVKELQKDVEMASQQSGRVGEKTTFSIFVLHNKDKTKKGTLPQDLEKDRYIAAVTVGDVWINYPWEAVYVQDATTEPRHVALTIDTATSMSTTGMLRNSRNSGLEFMHGAWRFHGQRLGGSGVKNML